MNFAPQVLTKSLNENGLFQEAFMKDPQTALNQIGLAVTNDLAQRMTQQLHVSQSRPDHDILSITRN
ncbi:MAG: hypothetical protein AAF629_15355 [Chloroflexota bacterium]